MLLALFGHAFFVSATHFHRVDRGATAPAAGISAGRDESRQDAPQMGAHAQCLLCRLQRNFTLGLQTSVPALVEPRPDGDGDVNPRILLNASAHLSLPTGRGPPTA